MNVDIRLDPELKLHILHLKGKFLPTRQDAPPTFDDKLSYIVDIDSAVVSVSTASMAHAMNAYVFGEPDAPLKNLKLTANDGRIKQEGTIRKGIGIPFEMVTELSATPDGKIRIHPVKMAAAHVPVKKLMRLFGLDMAKLINTRKTKGIAIDENDIILDPEVMLPPPKMWGKITSISVEGDDIVQTFGAAQPEAPGRSKSNFMAYRGGVLRFGKLTMRDADLRLIDADPRDPFDFYPDRYQQQLVAGYSKTTAAGGLDVFMPDYHKIAKPDSK